jgi:hypothetical protein
MPIFSAELFTIAKIAKIVIKNVVFIHNGILFRQKEE